MAKSSYLKLIPYRNYKTYKTKSFSQLNDDSEEIISNNSYNTKYVMT
jgi:hypothetical protein